MFEDKIGLLFFDEFTMKILEAVFRELFGRKAGCAAETSLRQHFL